MLVEAVCVYDADEAQFMESQSWVGMRLWSMLR